MLAPLSPLQRRLITALAKRDRRFFLTGGGVLAGFVLGHRTTDDLDFFTSDGAAMAEAESVRIDFVFDRVAQLYPKVDREGVLMDSTEEIFVNKICALVGRSEVRDMVDVMCLEATGLQVEDYLSAARTKDGGVSPATLAWVLSQLRIPSTLPGAVTRDELTSYAASLEARMRNAARPPTG